MTAALTLRYALERMLRPFTFKVDLTTPAWRVSSLQARGWLLAAVASDYAAQFLVGQPSLLTLAASLLTVAIFWFAPRVLTGAASAVYVTQCLVSIALLVSMKTAHLNQWAVLILSYAWQFVGLAALANVTLTYFRTSKQLMEA